MEFALLQYVNNTEGFAGGIVSAAVDGILVADALLEKLSCDLS